MVSVKNEINELLLNCVSDLENRLEESRNVLLDIQEKMDSKVNEAKEYKVQVDDAKDNIKRLECEIESLENDLTELKDKYGKKNLVAVIDAGTKEINAEVKKKQDEIQIHKNKITELTNRARSIKDLLMNLKKDKKIKEDRLKDLESAVNYYKDRLEDVVNFAEEHDNLDDYFITKDEETSEDSTNIFEDIVGTEEVVEEKNVFEGEKQEEVEEVSIEEAEEVFNDVISSDDSEEEDSFVPNDITFNLEEGTMLENFDIEEKAEEEEEEILETNTEVELDFNALVEEENDELEGTTELKIADLLNVVKEPIPLKQESIEPKSVSEEKIEKINETIDNEFLNVFGQDINEPIQSINFFGNESKKEKTEEEIVNKLTNMGIDYYSFVDSDKEKLKNNFNELVIKEIVNILKTNKIQLDNIYVDGNILFSIAPRELENIISKLINAGQSADAIGYILAQIPMVDSMLLDATINNYGEYIKNIDIVDIIFKSLKGDK